METTRHPQTNPWDMIALRDSASVTTDDDISLPVGAFVRTALDRYQARRARLARQYAGDTNHPVVEEPGNAAPRMDGESYYHTTPSGKTIVRHPNAYKWPTTYHASTLRVVVGSAWLDRALHDDVTPQDVVGCRNSELARRWTEQLGAERVFSALSPRILHEDVDAHGHPRRLCEARFGGDLRRYVVVIDPTTGATYYLPVSWRVQTCQEAVAATFGLRADEYAPARES